MYTTTKVRKQIYFDSRGLNISINNYFASYCRTLVILVLVTFYLYFLVSPICVNKIQLRFKREMVE